MDTSALRDLATAGGPFASVHFDESHDTEDGAKRLELRLKEIEAALTGQRADPETVAAVLRAVRESEPPAGKAGRSIVASHGSVLLDRRLAAPPSEQVARFSALPYLLPLATHEAETLPYLVVVADGCEVEPVSAYLRDLMLGDVSSLTLRVPKIHPPSSGGMPTVAGVRATTQHAGCDAARGDA